MRRTLVLLALAAVLLAGCSSTPDTTDDEEPGLTISTRPSTTAGTTSGSTSTTASAHTLSVSNFPQVAVRSGSAFSFQLAITGPQASSDHIGAHFGASAQPSPQVSGYSNACNHVAGDVPGTYTVTCTAPAAGTYYLRAHLRLGVDPGATHSWSSELSFTVTS
jgi:hypothetical protein